MALNFVTSPFSISRILFHLGFLSLLSQFCSVKKLCTGKEHWLVIISGLKGPNWANTIRAYQKQYPCPPPPVTGVYKTTSPFSYIFHWVPLSDKGVLWYSGPSYPRTWRAVSYLACLKPFSLPSNRDHLIHDARVILPKHRSCHAKHLLKEILWLTSIL